MRAINKIFIGKIFIGLILSCLFACAGQAQARKINNKKQSRAGAALTEKNSAEDAAQSDAPTTAPNAPANNNANAANAAQPKLNQPVLPRLQPLMLDRFLGQLDLAEEQKNKLRIIRQQHFRQVRNLLELERAQAKIYDESLYNDQFDAKTIEKRAADLAQTRTELLQAQTRLFIEVRQILTPEQFTKLRALMEEERARRARNVVFGQS